jgi:hypothetical protein
MPCLLAAYSSGSRCTVGASLVTGLALATVSLPAVDHLQDSVSAHIGVDAH